MHLLRQPHRALLAGLTLFTASARADEGLWLFSAPPRAQLKAKYGFDLTDAWLQHLMRSSVRFNSGGSGAFVSADGLVITNHHVAAADLQKLSDERHNHLRDGFQARTPADELRCVDLELNVLQSIEDVTARVNTGVPAGADAGAAALARRQVIAAIERESHAATGLRSDVVTLYQGGAYHVYRYKVYTDVRLVWAPEAQAASFGGDPDNFEFPRYALDAALYRVYEDGRPARVADYLTWSRSGVRDGELTLISGHPGQSNRQFTLAELAFIRDVQYPYTLPRIKRIEVLLTAWSGRSEENARRAREELLGYQNARKAYDGLQAGLYSPAIMRPKAAEEQAFLARMADRPEGPAVQAALARIAEAVAAQRRIYTRHRLLEGEHAFLTDSFSYARSLLRAGDERPKPNGERLEEFGDARRASFELDLFSTKPVHPDLEILLLTEGLTLLTETLGYEDPLVQDLLAGESPAARAAHLINGTRVREVAVRRELHAGGASAVSAARDPMIELARRVDATARALRQEWETHDEARQQAHAIIEQARFALEGSSRPPDATFTLRLSYGPVRGYRERGRDIPAFTTLAGMFARSEEHRNREPFQVPPRWAEKRSALDLGTPLNFVHTPDSLGGNSGSPVVNTAGEIVGLLFDGNLQSLSGDFAYEEEQSRSVSVDSRAILEALARIYGADDLVAELRTGRRP